MSAFSVAWQSLVRLCNVKQTYVEAIEVWKELSRERTIADPAADVSDEVLVARLAGRLGIALGVSEVCGTYMLSPGLAFAAQYSPGGNWFFGAIAGIAGDYFGAVFSFWVAWYLLCPRYYSEQYWFHPIRFAADLWYLHFCALGASVLLYAADFGATCAASSVVKLGSETVANRIPVVLWFALGNGIFEALYLGAAAGFVPLAAKRIVPRYRAYLTRRETAVL